MIVFASAASGSARWRRARPPGIRRKISGATSCPTEVVEFRAERVGDELIEAVLIDEAVVDQRLRDALAVEVRLLQDVIDLRRLQHLLFDEKIGDLIVVHRVAASSRLPA